MRIKELVVSKATIPAILAGIVGVLIVLYAWQLPPFTSSVQSTNNAYVKGQVTLMSPQLAGYVAEVPVTDYLAVKKGDLLVRLDDRIYVQQLAQVEATLDQQRAALANYDANLASKQASVDLAKAQLQASQAAFQKAQSDAERSTSLLEKGVSAQSSADVAKAALSQAQANVAAAQASVNIADQNLSLVKISRPGLEGAVRGAEAAVQLAQINVGNTRIVAPVDGRLGEVTARLGQYVSVGTQLTSVTPSHTWIIANFKETQMAGLAIGQKVDMTVDALDNAPLVGHISEISPAAGSEFAVLKADNATGNFTKIAQRISIRIEIDPQQPIIDRLLPGMSVEVSVDTASRSQT
jgi:multidrug resistance efflux pump